MGRVSISALARPTTARRLFRVMAVVEAITWAGLLAGMLAHDVFDTSRIGITVFGPLHGGAFVAYGVATLLAAWRLRWRPGVTVLGLLAAIPPFTTLLFEWWAHRRGLLDPARGAVAAESVADARVTAEA